MHVAAQPSQALPPICAALLLIEAACVLRKVRVVWVQVPGTGRAQGGVVIPCILPGQMSATILCLQADKKKTGRPIAFTGDPEDPALPAQVSSCSTCSRPGPLCLVSLSSRGVASQQVSSLYLQPLHCCNNTCR